MLEMDTNMVFRISASNRGDKLATLNPLGLIHPDTSLQVCTLVKKLERLFLQAPSKVGLLIS
jgi:hypothetical protein